MTDYTPWPDRLTHHYRQSGFWTGETFDAMLASHAKHAPDRVAVSDVKRQLTYVQLHADSEAVAAGLRERGLSFGDFAVVQASNTCDYVILLFALFRLGVAPVCALPAHRQAEIGYFAGHTQAAAYFHPDGPEYAPMAMDLAPNIPLIMSVDEAVALDGDIAKLPSGPAGDDIALLQLSGGSTGVPKLIPRTHDDYMYSVKIAAEVCSLDTDTIYLCALPAAHNFPLSSPGVLGVLYVQGQVVMASDPSPDTVFGLLDAYEVTITAAVPSLALMWLKAAKQRDFRPQTLQVLQVGGARMDEADARRVSPVLGATLQQVFGMAEGLVCYTRLGDPVDVVCETQGRPASIADEVRIVNDEDEPVTDGDSGHLLAQGPYTVRGYFRAADHNKYAFTSDGFYRTGDIVRRTPEGNVIVTGRAKDQVNRGGEKIAAAEIEEHLRAHEGIHDAALIGVTDAALGERSCACCIASADVTPAAVRRFLRERGLAAYKIPDLVRFVDDLPRTAIGKIDKKKLQERV